MSAQAVVAVAIGGFAGAPARLLVDRLVADRVESDLPWGTLLVNLSGSLLLGLLTGLSLHGHLGAAAGALLGTGFCGAYTTFSTWSFETLRLLEDGELRRGAANALGSLASGLAVAAAGLAIGLAC